ncbi:hypothetical protein NPIL_336171 [Nephila pilipes]|uniref:Uncharacterized protein n=1 Tax=Nephila pilipes TaxID=299642 RepID=A0A8X6UNJ2_NEPPI|nr:hypothetical protein NPIL_336171 [Nephila pilipes]
MIALLPICVSLAFLPKLPTPCVDKRNESVDKYHLRTCGALHLNTESSRHWEMRGFLGRSPMLVQTGSWDIGLR